MAVGANGTLYVDDTLTNSVSAIPDAATRSSALTQAQSTISQGGALNGPLGMTALPGGDLLVVNGNNGNAVQLSATGRQLTTRTLIKGGGGDLFGLALNASGTGVVLVNDANNTLELLHG